MHAKRTAWVVFWILFCAALPAQEPSLPNVKPLLEQKLDELEQVDQELALIEKELSAHPQPAAANSLEQKQQTAKKRQIELLREIAAIAGEPDPLAATASPSQTPEASPENHQLLEDQIERRQKHDDALLESNALRRSQNN